MINYSVGISIEIVNCISKDICHSIIFFCIKFSKSVKCINEVISNKEKKMFQWNTREKWNIVFFIISTYKSICSFEVTDVVYNVQCTLTVPRAQFKICVELSKTKINSYCHPTNHCKTSKALDKKESAMIVGYPVIYPLK